MTTMAELAIACGFDPVAPLPEGTILYVFSGRATGHGRLRAGEAVIASGPHEVGGLTPSIMDELAAARRKLPAGYDNPHWDTGLRDRDGHAIASEGPAGGWAELT